jgi:cholesterol transport system auxiliary component
VGISWRHSGGMRATIVVALALFAAGCSVLGGSSGPPPTYDLSTPTQFPGLRAPRGQLVVQGATALGPLDSDKIVVRPTPGEVQALADAQWVDGLTRLVQVRLIQTFENARRLRAVGRPTDRIVADYQLLLDIRAFEILADGLEAEVTIAAKIVGDRSGRIVAGRVFTARVPTTATQGPPALDALDQAWNRVAVDIVLWATRII